jgi:cell division protein FtsB
MTPDVIAGTVALWDRYDQIAADNRELRDENERLQHQIEDALDNQGFYKTSCDQLETINEKLGNEINALNEQINNLTKDLDDVTKQKARLEKAFMEKAAEVISTKAAEAISISRQDPPERPTQTDPPEPPASQDESHDDTDTFETDARFDRIISNMVKDKAGIHYEFERKGKTRIMFVREGYNPIMVYMPTINSVPQWSVKGQPASGMTDAIDKSRKKSKTE